jgi:hypothetical protein
MSSTAPEPVTEATKVAGNVNGADKYPDATSSVAEGFEGESPQAKQARAEALAHARAARAATAKYARLVSQQAGGFNRNSHNGMPADSFSHMMTTQGDRIGATEASLALTRIADQLRIAFLDDERMRPHLKAPLKAGLTGAAAWLPLMWLRPASREGGAGGFVSDPRVWSLGGIALITIVDLFKDQIFGHFRSDEDKAHETVAEISKHFDESFARIEKAMAKKP